MDRVLPTRPNRRLDIVVPVYKNAALVRRCVDSLLACRDEIAAHGPRLVLIDDSPGDADTSQLLSGYAGVADLLVLRNEANLGFGRSVNRGLDLARAAGRDVLLVNSDTLTFPGTLSSLLQAAMADPQIGFASPRSNNASICSLPHNVGAAPASPQEAHARWAQLSRTMPAFHFTPTAVGYYMFIAHAVIANLGGLREEFGVGYEEENELVMRAGKVGYRAVIANHAFAFHVGEASFALTDLDLGSHRHANLARLTERHPEFLPLVARYERSPHFRAESLMQGLLRDEEGRLKLALDLTGLGQHHNGTNEQAVAVVRSLVARHQRSLRITAICSELSFEFHGLDKIAGLYREEPGTPGLHGVAARLAQPFEMRDITRLETLAPVNVFAMLDTIAEDCGPLAVPGAFIELWDHVAEQANGLVFISRFSEQTFCARHRGACSLPRFTQLLPTRKDSYAKRLPASQAKHLLILGNHFAHKGADIAAQALSAAFPDRRIVVLGSETFQSGQMTGMVPGNLEPERIDRLFAEAEAVVLPSYAEGFGFGFMHALAAGRPIAARRIPPTEEMLATLDAVEGVFLFDSDLDLVGAVSAALQARASTALDHRATGWDDWVDAFVAFCLSLTESDEVFDRLARRLTAADRLRRQAGGDTAGGFGAGTAPPSAAPPPRGGKAVDLKTLLALEGEDFVNHAYMTLLRRAADKAGLEFYLGQLRDRVEKTEIIRALATSAEGRARDVKLEGLNELVIKRQLSRAKLFKRWFGK